MLNNVSNKLDLIVKFHKKNTNNPNYLLEFYFRFGKFWQSILIQ